ncbi:MAG: hypothetical protein WC456_01440 [Patescibacteria group bacterium]
MERSQQTQPKRKILVFPGDLVIKYWAKEPQALTDLLKLSKKNNFFVIFLVKKDNLQNFLSQSAPHLDEIASANRPFIIIYPDAVFNRPGLTKSISWFFAGSQRLIFISDREEDKSIVSAAGLDFILFRFPDSDLGLRHNPEIATVLSDLSFLPKVV